MSVGAGPDAEFFHVIAHGGNSTGIASRGVAQVGDHLFDLAKRDKISKGFLAGKEPDALAAVFGDVGAEEFLGLEAGRKEMDVVDESVADCSSA
jgi:hypothetical protein